ncbi:MAG: hypothetical protein AB1941_29495 [Gemmatimonadota bacterium]
MPTLPPPGADRAADPGRWRSAVLVVGHPGHELRVHGWMEIARPTVCVLTDGSGSGGEGRLESTTRVLERTGAAPGPVYGRMSDRDIYAAIMDRDLDLFRRLADELCAVLVARGATCVVGDSVEGYNPSHDVCRLVINAAVRRAGREMGAAVENYDFVLVGAPDQCPEASRGRMVQLSLDDAALARKLESADAYPELAGEVAAAISRFGVAPFQREFLRPVDLDDRLGWTEDEVPFYERHGEKRVAEGVYDRVLRFREHVVPVAEALWSHSTRDG